MRGFICAADLPPSDPFACLACGDSSATFDKCITLGCELEGKPMTERIAATDVDRLRALRMLEASR